jgi:hypothetical protein
MLILMFAIRIDDWSDQFMIIAKDSVKSFECERHDE